MLRDVEDEIADEVAKLYTKVDGFSPEYIADVLASGADAELKLMVKSGKSSVKLSAKLLVKSSVRSTMSCSLFGFGALAGWMIVVSSKSGEAATNRESVFDSGLWTGPTPAITDVDVSIKLQG